MYLHVLRETGGVGGVALPPAFETAGFRSFCDQKGMGVAFMPASRCNVYNYTLHRLFYIVNVEYIVRMLLYMVNMRIL